ncbi:hypothetical protein [Ostreiculturibacter nitratireducens]|uniref:hypothetical protein n=1 Tax=Ostreiculturibacter nitratireducens TaxID=3075226 RepID=UPI0031B60BFE
MSEPSDPLSPAQLIAAIRRDLSELRAATAIAAETEDLAVAASHALAAEAAKSRIIENLSKAEDRGFLAGFEDFLKLVYGT